jgi:FemAB-related protein (PEP-CTERM system-associated)
MNIIRCDPSHDSAWNAFVQNSPVCSFYHRAEWREINERAFGHRTCYLAASEGGRILGVFPLVQLKSVLFGNIACSLPFVNYGGPVGECEDIERALLDAGAAVAEEWKVDYLEIRSRRHLGDKYPSSEHKVSMTVDLHENAETLWNTAGIPRQDIRRGYKNGFTASFGGADLLDDFYDVLSQSWRDLGTPIYQIEYLRMVLRTFPSEARICVVRAADRTPAAAAFIGHHRDVVEGMWLGTREQFRRQSVGYVLYWELIKDACERQYKRFHLGRSTAQSGGEQFKKKWKAYPTQLYWHYLLRTRTEIPQLNVTNSRYKLAIAAWRKLPVRVTQQIGPRIARSIP